MEELISKKRLIADLNEIREVLSGRGDPILASVLTRAIRCVEEQPAIARPETESFLHFNEEDRKLEKAIMELRKSYEVSKYKDHVYNKLGWALYHIWQKYR